MKAFYIALQAILFLQASLLGLVAAFSPSHTVIITTTTTTTTPSRRSSSASVISSFSTTRIHSSGTDAEEKTMTTATKKNKSLIFDDTGAGGEEEKAAVLDEFTKSINIEPSSSSSSLSEGGREGGFSYVEFAKTYPFVNNVGIATVKTAAADLLAQTVIAGTPIDQVDLQRSLLFCLFGALYLGAFQYAYQVQVFKRLFDGIDQFTSQSWAEKLQDIPGLKALGAQTGLDLTILTLVYLPTFYIFKASVFSGSLDPSVWVATGMDNYQTNFSKDEADLIKVWLPADLVCFSVPLYLRLPVRHIVSFVWTAYLSFSRGGH